MTRRKSIGQLHVGDIVIYDKKRRMRVAGFPTNRMVILVAQVFTSGEPSEVKTLVTDRRIEIVTQVRSESKEEE